VTREIGQLAGVLLVAVLAPAPARTQEVTARGLLGNAPAFGDRELFQPGTQPCTIPGYSPSCFHTAQTDDFDRKFHPAQGELSKLPPLDDLHPTANALRPGDSPFATDGTEAPREELVCANCHGNYEDPRTGAPAGDSPYDTWKATMMAQAWRDPLARAAIAVANHGLSAAKIDFARGEYTDGPRGQTGRTAGDYCIRCHSPVGWLEGFSLPADGSRVHGKQMDGVQCDFCHRMVNPLTHTAKVPDVYEFTRDLPDSLLDPSTREIGVSVLHNANFIVNTTGRKIGPFLDPVDLRQHPLDAVEVSREPPADPRFGTAAEENAHFLRNSQFCAVCHNVTNPFLVRLLPDGTPVTVGSRRQKMPVERTYTEWYFSDCGPPTKSDPNLPLPPDLEEAYDPDSLLGCENGHRSCQSCHMPRTEGFAANPELTGVRERGPREIRQHLFVGGNAWVPTTIPLFFPDQSTLAPAFERIRALARQNLERAATLEVRREGSKLRIDVVNRTGHKLPTGYPEGRRMWLHVQAFDGQGQLRYESGAYDEREALLRHDRDLKLWAAELGIKKPGRPAEESFQFVLNNVVLQDNRIAPRGFEVSRAAEEAAIVVRADRDCRDYELEFADPDAACHAFDYDGDGRSDGRDVVFYELPAETAGVRVALRYQTASREYVEFLADPANAGDFFDRFGAGLFAAWKLTGMSSPIEMACAVDGTVPSRDACGS
jgi:hypothetical protein